MKRILSIILILSVAGAAALFATGQVETEGAAAVAGATGDLSGYTEVRYNTLADFESMTGQKITEFKQAPQFDARVSAGELPPVGERISDEPMVLVPKESIGRYGGEIKSGMANIRIEGADVSTTHFQPLLKLDHDLQTVIPNLAKAYELSDDLRTLTLTLRKGVKWSDGEPFTTDDIMFWYQDIILNKELAPQAPRQWAPGGNLMKVEQVDDYTVRFRFQDPNPSAVDLLAVGPTGALREPFKPKHYLSKWHIKYNPKANDVAKAEGYESWFQAFGFHMDGDTTETQRDPERPGLSSWVLTRIDTNGNKYFDRNPYYWKVDVAGNQLPYADRLVGVMTENREVEKLKAIAGEMTYSNVRLAIGDYTLFKEGEAKGDYTTLLWPDARGSMLAFTFNMNHKDPVLREIFNDIRWRQAMSLALDREDMNQALFFGRARPVQATVLETASYFEDWMLTYYTEHDPDRANRLLDEMGLTVGADGFRMRPDGKTLEFTIEYFRSAAGIGSQVMELVKEYWDGLHLKISLKEDERTLYGQRANANELDLGSVVFNASTEFTMRQNPYRFRPPWQGGAELWEQWYLSGGATGEEPPVEVKELLATIDDWQKTVPGTPRYLELGKKVAEMNVKNLYAIGTVGYFPRPFLVTNSLRNAPTQEDLVPSCTWDYRFFLQFDPDQWYFVE